MCTDAERYPLEVVNLHRREREIAQIVYSAAGATAKDVQAALRKPLTNSATRSMLNRLVRKKILRLEENCASREFTYLPAINNAVSQENAIRRLADDFFDGSLADAAAAIVGLARRARTPSLARHIGSTALVEAISSRTQDRPARRMIAAR